MPGESQRVPESVPDPTVYVQAAIDRAAESLKIYIDAEFRVRDQRLRDIDKAADVLNETVTRTPTDIQKEILHLRELTSEHFDSISLQFAERDVRSERESKDNVKAVDAAFAAQKEAAAKQDESNQKSIDKTERQFNETINKMAELFKTTTDALSRQFNDKYDALARQVNDNKSHIDRYEARQNGSNDQRTEHRQSNAAFYATVGMGLTLILAAITIIGFIAANKP